MLVFGFHSVEAALRESDLVKSLYLLGRNRDARLNGLRDIAISKKIAVREFSANEKIAFENEYVRVGGETSEVHSIQGVFAVLKEGEEFSHLEVLRMAKKKSQNPIILYLDTVTDPQNLGSMLRSAAFFGVSAVVTTEHRSAALTPAAKKISSGGFLHVPLVRVSNLVNALSEAKEEGYWIAGLSEHAEQDFTDVATDGPLGLIIGNEEKGLRPLTLKHCDYTVSLESFGPIKSLNAAVATAIALSRLRYGAGVIDESE